MIIWIVQKETSQGCNEKTVATAYPYLMSRGFIVEFVLEVKSVVKKNTGITAVDAPLWLKSKVLAHLNEKKQV